TVNLRCHASSSAADISPDDDYGDDDDGGGDDGSSSSFSFSFTFQPDTSSPSLVFGFYDETCPDAEDIISSTVRKLCHADPNVAAALVRLSSSSTAATPRCYWTASTAAAGDQSATPDRTRHGRHRGDEAESGGGVSKNRLLRGHPGARRAGQPRPRRRTNHLPGPHGPPRHAQSFYHDGGGGGIPPPNATYGMTQAAFARRGREFTYGAGDRRAVRSAQQHREGAVRCRFFADRIWNFAGTGAPDDSVDPDITNGVIIL
ncbi:LOW QUALITY PROTEIN: hypothetical protein SORBI_3006G013200, partial [Sorghum bicolor]